MRKSIIFSVVIGISIASLFSCLNSTIKDYGHHFDIVNKLGHQIDSVNICIGDKSNWLYKQKDTTDFQGNLDLPNKGYPHQIKIITYFKGVKTKFPTTLFDCYNCDGYHYITLEKGTAKYHFSN